MNTIHEKLVAIQSDRFTILSELPIVVFPGGGSQRCFKCRCECGMEFDATYSNIVQGRTKGCGCHRYKHNLAYSRAYHSHNGMMQRCHNPKSRDYARWGARGITVAPEWHDFQNFYRDMGDPPEGHSLERSNNNGPYSKENCVWATAEAQCNNRRSNIRLTYNGSTLTLMQWSRKLGIQYKTLCSRFRRNLSTTSVFYT